MNKIESVGWSFYYYTCRMSNQFLIFLGSNRKLVMKLLFLHLIFMIIDYRINVLIQCTCCLDLVWKNDGRKHGALATRYNVLVFSFATKTWFGKRSLLQKKNKLNSIWFRQVISSLLAYIFLWIRPYILISRGFWLFLFLVM